MTEDKELVEKVARAIYEGRNGRGCKPWSICPKAHKEPYLKAASAVIRLVLDRAAEVADSHASLDDASYDAASEHIATAIRALGASPLPSPPREVKE